MSYLDTKIYEPLEQNIDDIKNKRISVAKFFEFMESSQKVKLTMNDYKKTISYFDETADEETLSVQGNELKIDLKYYFTLKIRHGHYFLLNLLIIYHFRISRFYDVQ